MSEYKIETNTFAEGVIEQVLRFEDPARDLKQEIMRQVMNTKEEQTKRALINLGWTPPREPSDKDHPFYCFICGTGLVEATLGVLHCETCDRQLIPTTDEHDYQTLTIEPTMEEIVCKGCTEVAGGIAPVTHLPPECK